MLPTPSVRFQRPSTPPRCAGRGNAKCACGQNVSRKCIGRGTAHCDGRYAYPSTSFPSLRSGEGPGVGKRQARCPSHNELPLLAKRGACPELAEGGPGEGNCGRLRPFADKGCRRGVRKGTIGGEFSPAPRRPRARTKPDKRPKQDKLPNKPSEALALGGWGSAGRFRVRKRHGSRKDANCTDTACRVRTPSEGGRGRQRLTPRPPLHGVARGSKSCLTLPALAGAKAPIGSGWDVTNSLAHAKTQRRKEENYQGSRGTGFQRATALAAGGTSHCRSPLPAGGRGAGAGYAWTA